MNYPLNLGQTGPSMTMAMPHMKDMEPEAYYPSAHIEGEGLELPDEGTITFRYRTSRESEDKKTETCCYDLDLLEIVSVKAAAGEKKDEYNEASEGLDKLKAELEKE